MFRRLFGESKSKDSRPFSSSVSRTRENSNSNRQAIQTITQLQESEDMIEKKLDKFNEEIRLIEEKTRQCLKKVNPDRLNAIRFIKQRKQIEQQRNKLYQIKDNIQLVNQQVQSAHFNKQVTETLNIGQQQLKKTQKLIPTNQIEDIIDNLNEQIDISNEINDLLSTPIQTNQFTNSDIDIENELNQLDQQIIQDNLTKINLPNAHQETIQIDKSSIDQQLKQLQRLTTE